MRRSARRQLEEARPFYRAIVQTTAEFKYTCHVTELLRKNYSHVKVSHLGRLSPFTFFRLARQGVRQSTGSVY